MRGVPGAPVDAGKEQRRAERRKDGAGERVEARCAVPPQGVVEDPARRAAGDARSDDLRGRGREERDERERHDRRERRIDDAEAPATAGEELVQPGRRLIQPPAAVEHGGGKASEIVIVGRQADAGGEIDPRRDRSDPDRGHAVRHAHPTRTR